MLLCIDPVCGYEVLASLYTLMPPTTCYVCILSPLFPPVPALPCLIKGVYLYIGVEGM